MSGIVLAVGALLVVAGIAEIYIGSGDILSERGWSAFIAGAVLLGSGAVTMSLGAAVRALEQIRGALLRLPSAAAADPLPRRIEPEAAPDPIAAFPYPAGPETIAIPAAAPVDATHHEIATYDLAESGGDHDRQPPGAPDRLKPSLHEPLQDDDVFEAAPTAAEPVAEDWHYTGVSEMEHEASASDHPLAEQVPQEPLHPPAAEPHDAGPAGVPSPVAEWSVAADHVEPALAEAPAHADVGTEHAEPAFPPATVSAREAATAHESAVIGRYESEGTSYVMYADGSIDAQSESGVYRFASMAELKAFIES